MRIARCGGLQLIARNHRKRLTTPSWPAFKKGAQCALGFSGATLAQIMHEGEELRDGGGKKRAMNDLEPGIGIRKLRIDKCWRKGHSVKIAIIDFHHAAPEIGDIQAGLAICMRAMAR